MALLLSHALADSVAMANLLGSELSGLFIEVTRLDNRIGLSSLHATHLHSMHIDLITINKLQNQILDLVT